MADFASTAANLANSKRKIVDKHELPNSPHAKSAAANARAKPAEQSPSHRTQNTLSTASSKAALLAHARNPRSHDAKASSNSVPATSPDGPDKALLAATKSFKTHRPTEVVPPSTSLSSKGAGAAQRRVDARRQESSSRNQDSPSRHRSDVIHIAPEMLTEHPPLRMERDDKKHQEALRASAVSLARGIYSKDASSQSNISPDFSNAAKAAAQFSKPVKEEPPAKQQALHYVSLQDTAKKMAAQRLARINNSNEDSAYRSYYGVSTPQRSKSQKVVNKARLQRNRSGSDPEDMAQSQRIRSQMTLLQAQIAQVDSSKMEQDRQRLLEAAKKKVQGDMTKMDQAVFKETGKMSPAMMEEWENKARSRIKEKREVPMMTPDTAVDVGGGKLLDRSDIDDLAKTRVKPTLEGINEAVAKKHAEEQAAREREEERKREAKEKKEKEREIKAENKRIHDEEKAEKKRIHDEEKAEKKRIHDAEKAEKKAKREAEKADKKAIADQKKAAKADEKQAEKDPHDDEQPAQEGNRPAPRDSILSHGDHDFQDAVERQESGTPKRSLDDATKASPPDGSETRNRESLRTPSPSEPNRRGSVFSRFKRRSLLGAIQSRRKAHNSEDEDKHEQTNDSEKQVNKDNLENDAIPDLPSPVNELDKGPSQDAKVASASQENEESDGDAPQPNMQVKTQVNDEALSRLTGQGDDHDISAVSTDLSDSDDEVPDPNVSKTTPPETTPTKSPKKSLWKRFSIHRTKSNSEDSPRSKAKNFLKRGDEKSDSTRSFQVLRNNGEEKPRPEISSPVPDSMRVLTPLPNSPEGTEIVRGQEKRNDRLAGQHVDSKFSEDIGS